MRTRLIITIAVVVALCGVVASAQALTTISREQASTSVSSVGSTIAWGSYDPATKTYKLMTVKDGKPVALPVAPSKEPFDVDLGTNRSGEPTAVYTRCDKPAQPAHPTIQRGCDIYRVVLATGREQKLTTLSSPTADEIQPTIWRGEIAFVRHEGSRYVLRLGNTTTGSKGTKALVSVPADKKTLSGIIDPQLSLQRIAYTVTGLGHYGFGERVLHVRTLKTGLDRAIYRATSGGANFAYTTRPSWTADGKQLFFARTNNGSGQGNRYIRWTPSTGKFAYAKGSSRVQSTSWLGGDQGMFVSLGYGQGICDDGPSAPPICQVGTTGPLTFAATP